MKKKTYKHIPIKSNVQRQPKNYYYTDAAKAQQVSNGNESKNGSQKPKKRTNRKKNNKDQRLQNKESDSDEFSLLRRELAEIKTKFASEEAPYLFMQEGFRSKKKDIDYNFQYLYFHHWMRQEDLECYIKEIYTQYNDHSITCMIYSIYLVMNRVGWKFHVLIKRYHYCSAFEQELQSAMKMTEYIIIGGDWNAHHPAWLDHNIDDVGECILDFIVSNGLHIITTLPFDSTFMKDNATSSIDITLCSSSILQFVSNWGQMMLNWILRLKRNIDNWMKSIDPIVSRDQDSLDKAVESWTKCVVEAGEATIGIKTIWKGDKPWWSDSQKKNP
ncbi:hypothetical protein RFI_20919 [Reticulomyxa filosa]|uniref:Endonuclease/exonuclease/phosphatase domain-containing protein n=1 Tax=Reticulomyxa filosa TaxID=46433 RepID=X6MRK4_RETFI|nr:hypothetical protein RFI_20919 [Reticulomyxa filosa]|eukprot:ETO16419.1 hypothetical protein RFI_20919 [Reticulomyxa filosa]